MATKHQEHWAGYWGDFDGGAARILADIGWADEKPPKGMKHLVLVRIPLGPDDEDLVEFVHELEAFDDALIAAIKRSLSGECVGVLQTSKFRWWVFYVPSVEGIERVLSKVSMKCPDRSPELIMEKDPEWTFYRGAIAPDDVQRRYIADDSVVRALYESGDDLNASRPIEHLAILPESKARDKFVKWCEKNGFTVMDAASEADKEWGGFAVEFHHVGPAVTEEIWEKSSLATEGAEKFGGMYDGWQSSIVKKKRGAKKAGKKVAKKTAKKKVAKRATKKKSAKR